MSSKTIVVGYDGTDGSKAALAEALTVAEEIGGDIVAVFAYDRVIVGGESHDLDAQVHARGDAMLAEAEATAQAAGDRAAQGVHRGERRQRAREVADEVRRALHRRRLLRRAAAEGRDRRLDAVQADPPRRAPGHRRPHPGLTCTGTSNRYRAGSAHEAKVTVADG